MSGPNKASRPRTVLVTGGAGFIGSNFCHYWTKRHPDDTLVCVDKLTYAGNLQNLKSLLDNPNFKFVKADVAAEAAVCETFRKHDVEWVFHFAAESHVDRSISGPKVFVETNITGTLVLLDAARSLWPSDDPKRRFIHVSTDEVYGSLGSSGEFTEESPYAPNSPYSATKAGSDHLVRAYRKTYGLSCNITHCSNNYGPYQFPEKLIPLMIHNIIEGKELPVYGDGTNVRDWIHVEDHCRALDAVAKKGDRGETYNIGGGNELQNIQLVRTLCRSVDRRLGRKENTSEALIRFVTDRPGHDLRYAIDSTKLQNATGWKPSWTFEKGLAQTVDWYLSHPEWVREVTSGQYQRYTEEMYGNR